MKQTAVEWLSNQAYELFEQYSEGKFDRINLNKLMVDATEKAKAMEKEQIINTFKHAQVLHAMNDQMRGEQYYNETFKSK